MAKSYFSHDSNAKDDPKIIKLIDTLGLEGYGAFWVLIELLREQPNLRLPIASIPRICRTFGITNPKMESVIYHFELFSNDGEYFFSPSLIKRMLEMKEKYTNRSLEGWKTRLQNIDNQQNLLEAPLQSNQMIPQNDADAMQNDAKNANEIKVNKSKLNKNKIIEYAFPSETFRSYFNEWIIYRKEKKKELTESTIKRQNKFLSQYSEEIAIQIIEKSITNGWEGLFELKEGFSADRSKTKYELEIEQKRKEALSRAH